MKITHREEWRYEIVMALIGNGRTADDAIVEAKEIEGYLFSSPNLNETLGNTETDNLIYEIGMDSSRSCIETAGNTATDGITSMIEESRANARAALKVIYQYQFATVDELVQQMARLAYGDVYITGSSLK